MNDITALILVKIMNQFNGMHSFEHFMITHVKNPV